MKACFMGLGYIGLPTAIIAAEHGIEVIGVDINPQVVDMTNQGLIHIVEPGLQELCRKVVMSGHLKASVKPETSDVYLVVVPTPVQRKSRTGYFLCGNGNPFGYPLAEGK